MNTITFTEEKFNLLNAFSDTTRQIENMVQKQVKTLIDTQAISSTTDYVLSLFENTMYLDIGANQYEVNLDTYKLDKSKQYNRKDATTLIRSLKALNIAKYAKELQDINQKLDQCDSK
ncbi:hypothetical protein KPA96_13740 [Burkholderia cenocepacia]|uniref:hypothetical protein n=1 Tax=Burkholderia cenocepacia TaxID=95486 RepID=UPI0028640ED3|nr:hypothetical protein [Burkholderia cenocepacia]MCB4346816.1 hypothetical protein [Burkholderia vietnamiensis]MDR8076719.1 hypothetical protein [Burkholderia cenocepacia]